MNNLKAWMLVFVGLVLGGVLAYGLSFWHTSDPQGDENASCGKFDGPTIANRKGLVVSSHTTTCSTLGTSVVSYVYVHPVDQSPTKDHLVFRYSQDGAGDVLQVAWRDERHVVLQVNRVTAVSKILTSSGTVLIDYNILGR